MSDCSVENAAMLGIDFVSHVVNRIEQVSERKIDASIEIDGGFSIDHLQRYPVYSEDR